MPRRFCALGAPDLVFPVLLLSILTIPAMTFPVAAALKSEKKPVQLDYSILPSHVHLNPINVPIDNTNPTRAMVTIYFGPHKLEKIGHLCRMAPRIIDAVLLTLSRQPIPMNGRKMDIANVGHRLLRPVNDALEENIVKEIHVLPGPPTDINGADTKLPFGRANGCKRVNDMLEILERQKQQESGKR